jgi:glutamate racemase
MNAAPIGIFDSGIGGLTVVRAVYERLPRESTVYFGDTARVPYGPKSPETVTRYSLEILDWLLKQQVKAVVVACNTSTAHALSTLQRQSPVPVIGVIEPGARAAAAASTHGPIGVIGTAGTIASNAYARAIQRVRPDARVEQKACPLFVPLVEEGWFEHPAAELIAREYLEPLRLARVDTLVLGCTHYPLLKPLLQRVMGPEVRLIDSGEETAAAVEQALADASLTAPSGAATATHRFAVSDDEVRFRQVGARFIGERMGRAEVVPLS